MLWTSHVDPLSAANVQTHFSSCAGVEELQTDGPNSEVTVFGKVNPIQVLKKLKRVD